MRHREIRAVAVGSYSQPRIQEASVAHKVFPRGVFRSDVAPVGVLRCKPQGSELASPPPNRRFHRSHTLRVLQLAVARLYFPCWILRNSRDEHIIL